MARGGGRPAVGRGFLSTAVGEGATTTGSREGGTEDLENGGRANASVKVMDDDWATRGTRDLGQRTPLGTSSLGRGGGDRSGPACRPQPLFGTDCVRVVLASPPIVLEEGETNGGREMGQFVYGDRGGLSHEDEGGWGKGRGPKPK